MFRLFGKTAYVTGGVNGIGIATVIKFLKKDVIVEFTDLDTIRRKDIK